MVPNSLRFAVIGCGHIGQRHIKVLQSEPNADLVAVCDIKPEIINQLKETYPQLEAYTSLEELLSSSAIDIVCICTPHGLHAEMSIQAVRAKKHVLVEKPMALNAKQSREMIAEAKENGVRLFVVKQNRYNQPITLTTKALEDKKLGRIFMVQCNVLWNRHEDYYTQSEWRGKKSTEGGVLHTQVSHFLDLLVWWFGDVKEAKTIKKTLNHNIEIEDSGVSALNFDSGVLGSLVWTTCVYNYNYEGSITIIGEKGTIKIGGRYLNEIEFWDVQSYPLPTDTKFDDEPNNYGFYQGSSSNHDKLIYDLIHEIIEKRQGVVEGEEGLKSIEAIETIYGGE